MHILGRQWKMTPRVKNSKKTVDITLHRHTTVVLEPHRLHVEGGTNVQDVCIGALLQIRQAQLGAG